jgi:hypothetical protein
MGAAELEFLFVRDDIERGEEYSRLRALWAAVIVQAIADAQAYLNGSGKERAATRASHGRDAIRWLFAASDAGEFALVCDRVDLEPAVVRIGVAARLGRSLDELRAIAEGKAA